MARIEWNEHSIAAYYTSSHPPRKIQSGLTKRAALALEGVQFTFDTHQGILGGPVTHTTTIVGLTGSSAVHIAGWALHVAAYVGDVLAVRWLLQHGGYATGSIHNNYGSTPLMLAAERGSLDVVKFLLRDEHSYSGERGDHGDTPLLCAAYGGQLDTVQWLLDEGGSSIHESNAYGHDAVVLAAEGGHLATVQWLLELSDAARRHRCTPVGMPDTALSRAVLTGSLLVVQWLVENGWSFTSERDKAGNTTLLQAASHGQLSIVQWLLNTHRSSIEEANIQGLTALLAAANNGRALTVKWLLQYGGSDISELSLTNHSALHLACKSAFGELPMWLLNTARVDPGIQSNSGQTVLIWAAQTDNAPMIAALLADGRSDPDHEDVFGCTALMAACKRGCLDSLTCLVRVLGVYQARLWFSNWNGDFPLTVALLFGHTVMAEWLLCNFPGVVRLVSPSKFRNFQWAETLLLIAYDATVETPPIYLTVHTPPFDNANLPWLSIWADRQLSVSHVVTCLAAQRVFTRNVLGHLLPVCVLSTIHSYVRSIVDGISMSSVSPDPGDGPADNPAEQAQFIVALLRNLPEPRVPYSP
jgi:ankyrin repeat protein